MQARLQQIAESGQTLFITDTPEATQARLEQRRQRHTGVNPDMPLFEQSAV